MTAAFASMTSQPPNIMILSEMLELGSATAMEHDALMPQINALSPRLVIGLGPAMHKAIHRLNSNISVVRAANTSAALKVFETTIQDGDVVFIKGSLGSGAWEVCDSILTGLINTPSLKTPKNNMGNSHVT